MRIAARHQPQIGAAAGLGQPETVPAVHENHVVIEQGSVGHAQQGLAGTGADLQFLAGRFPQVQKCPGRRVAPAGMAKLGHDVLLFRYRRHFPQPILLRRETVLAIGPIDDRRILHTGRISSSFQ